MAGTIRASNIRNGTVHQAYVVYYMHKVNHSRISELLNHHFRETTASDSLLKTAPDSCVILIIPAFDNHSHTVK